MAVAYAPAMVLGAHPPTEPERTPEPLRPLHQGPPPRTSPNEPRHLSLVAEAKVWAAEVAAEVAAKGVNSSLRLGWWQRRARSSCLQLKSTSQDFRAL